MVSGGTDEWAVELAARVGQAAVVKWHRQALTGLPTGEVEAVIAQRLG